MTSAEFKAIRLQLGLTQAELGQIMGMAQTAIARIENERQPTAIQSAFINYIKKKTINERNYTVDNCPFKTQPCGCRRFPSFTEGCWVDNFWEGQMVWQEIIPHESWTDTSECSEGHQS